MNYTKQKVVLTALRKRNYGYDDGKVHMWYKGKKKPLSGGLDQNGLTQVIISNELSGEYRKTVTVYLHELIYIMHKGQFPQDMKVVHVSGTDNRIENLQLIPNVYFEGAEYIKTQRLNEQDIANIHKLHSEGKNQSEMARELNIPRLVVRYHTLKLKNQWSHLND